MSSRTVIAYVIAVLVGAALGYILFSAMNMDALFGLPIGAMFGIVFASIASTSPDKAQK